MDDKWTVILLLAKIRDFSLLHKHPDQFWGSASLLSNGLPGIHLE
jgi:hypothetical protein